MGEKKGEDFYCNFSRKDLQALCKKYGLPARKSNSEMATSLILYLEKKNINSRTIWDATRSDPLPSGTPELQAAARVCSMGDQPKDCKRPMSHSGSRIGDCNNRDARLNGRHSRKGSAASDKASDAVGSLTQLQKDSSTSAGLPENALSFVVTSRPRAPPPSFQFDVRSEDGIQLYVDLNSSPKDWIDSLKSEVHHELGQLCCSRQIKGSIPSNSCKEMDSGAVDDGSCPATAPTQAQADDPDVGEESLSSPGLDPFRTAVHSIANSEGQATISTIPESETGKQVCLAESCSRREETGPAVSDLNAVTQNRACNDLSETSLSSDPKGSGVFGNQGVNAGSGADKEPSLQQADGSPELLLNSRGSSASPGISSAKDRVQTRLDLVDQPQSSGREHCGLPTQSQSPDPINIEHRMETDHCRAPTTSNSSRQITEVPKHLASVHWKTMTLSPDQRCETLGAVDLTEGIEADIGRILPAHDTTHESVEMCSFLVGFQSRDAALPCSNVGSQNLDVPKQNGIGHCLTAQSNELYEDICEREPTSVGKLGSNAGDGKESSECLDFRDLMDETLTKPDESSSNGELKRKRVFNSVEVQSQSLKPDAKVFRTSRQIAKGVHASRRRSSRLFTK